MDVMIYSKPVCSFCTQAKNLLTIFGVAFNERVLDKDFTREWLLEQYSTARTFPVVVIDGMYIGGFDELYKYLHEERNNQTLLTE
jgi:glutaredoxin 3